jgi:hypothetical protein
MFLHKGRTIDNVQQHNICTGHKLLDLIYNFTLLMLSVEKWDKQIDRHAELTKRELCAHCVLNMTLLFTAIN